MNYSSFKIYSVNLTLDHRFSLVCSVCDIVMDGPFPLVSSISSAKGSWGDALSLHVENNFM